MKRLTLTVLALLIAGGMLFAAGEQEEGAAAAERELTIWEDLWYNASVSVSSLAETPLYKEVMDRTGITVEWIHPPQGQADENFNLMIASNELPDMIYRGWNGYPGGPSKAINDAVIIEINDVIQNSMPNLWGHLQSNPEWLKAAKTDDGTLYMIPFIRGHEDLMVFYGPQMRKDWLDQLGFERPETLDEWETILTAMKEEGLVEYPLTFTAFNRGRGINGAGGVYPFGQAFGTSWDFHKTRDNVVQFGPYMDEFKDSLVFFKDWFDKGLVDPEFFSNERKTFDAKILNGEAGAWVSYTGSGIGAYLDAARAAGDTGSFDITPVKYPVLEDGDTPFYGQRDNPLPGQGMAITSQAENVELCAEFADYAYSDEGHLLFNFGIEGESYTWITDYSGFEGTEFPRYTELMWNNPDGKTLAQMGGLYTRAFYSGPIIQDRRYIYQYAHRPAQREAIQLWAQTEADDHKLPLISATPDESEELAAIMSEVNTYRDEMVVRFITGQESLDNFDQYQAQLEQMGIERAIEIKQAGLDRYMAR